MKSTIVYTENIERANGAINLLRERSSAIPGMGLFYGAPGTGKSKCLRWLRTNPDTANGIFLRANRGFSPCTLLNKILLALDLESNHRNAVMLEAICNALTNSDRLIFIDEADYLLHYPASLDYLRDIHDLTKIPVILMGMADGGAKDIHRRLSSYKQLDRRMVRRVEFKPATWDDLELFAEELCEVRVAEDALADIYGETKGNHGLICNQLEIAERIAKDQQWESINAAQRKAKLVREGVAA